MKNYVFINQMRYGERIKVNYFISPDCLAFKIPKLIIQPFIENAFFHAFNKKNRGKYSYSHCSKGGEALCAKWWIMEMEWRDKGFTLPELRSKRKLFSGIGVRNVHERINYYMVKVWCEISSEIGEGTTVKIRLPLLKSEKITRK